MRRRLRSVIIYLVVLLIVMSSCAAYAATPQDWDKEHPENLLAGHLFAEAAIVVDENTGEVLFGKNADQRMFPASTTKIMTLMLTIESGIPLDSIVTIPKEVEDIPNDSSTVPVHAGEEMTLQDLMYGMMLRSGNDAAIALAIIVSGSTDRFVALMNQRASELGCTNTNFVNPHGYHNSNHYTTASDLAKITVEAMKDPVFRQIAAAPEYVMAPTSQRGKMTITTRVDMLKRDSKYFYENCTGIKTGFHSKAGQCMVGSAQMGDRTVIAISLFSTRDYAERKWYDEARMFEYGFTCYEKYSVRDMFEMADESITTISVENAVNDDPYGGKLGLILAQTSDDDYSIMALKNSNELSDNVYYFNSHCTVTPAMDYLDRIARRETVEAGSIIGELAFITNEGEKITGMLIASRSVDIKPEEVALWAYLKENIPVLAYLEKPIVKYGIIAVLVLIVALIITAAIRTARRNKRRRRIYEQRRRAYYQKQRAMNARLGNQNQRPNRK